MLFLITFVITLATSIPIGISSSSLAETEISPYIVLPASFQETTAPLAQRQTDGNTVLLLVADYVASPLVAELTQFQADLISEGWNVEMQTMSGGTAADMKTIITNTTSIDGVIFIGFLPNAWFEEDYWAPEEFPCELYFMDLDGNWSDSDSNGLLDTHTGDVAPEIWAGRIDAHAADFGSELLMLKDYFQKNHLYRTGVLTPPVRALAYNDDDWNSYTDAGLNAIYGSSNVTVVNSSSQTTASNYLTRLEQGFEFVHLMAHSSPWGHTFKIPSGMGGTVMAPEIAQVNPNTAFLQLFSCSNARWTETGCLGNWYLFGTDMGLLISGAAKTGSMLDFEYFYSPVGSGSTFGEAFRNWWEYEAQGGFSSTERAWFYGNALLGDPTLKPVGGTAFNAAFQNPSESTDLFAVSTSAHSDCFPVVDRNESITTVVWQTGENGRLDIAARFYDDASDSWSQVYYVDPDEYWDNAATVCFDNSNEPWLAWSDFDINTYSYRIKTAHGIPFENIEVAVPQDGYQVSPDLAYTDRMWLVWQNAKPTGGAIMIKALDESLPTTQISTPGAWTDSPGISEGPDGKLHALWVKQSLSGSSVMYSSGDENGFSAPLAISTGSFCHSPSISFVNGELIAVWQNDEAISQIVSRVWDGSAWNTPQEITSGNEHLINPVISSLTTGTIVIWQEGRSDAIAMASTRETDGWSAPFQPISPSGPVWNPVASGNNFFWAGTEGSDWNIYTELATGIESGSSSAPNTVLPILSNNPSSGNLAFSLPGITGVYEGKISLFDVSGRVVIQETAYINAGDLHIMDCSSLPSGVYSLIVQNGLHPVRFTLLK